ncbi:MAG: hypothetical protein GY861_22840, partial [bacterium]|nr:hypothetical protein [bacterium]
DVSNKSDIVRVDYLQDSTSMNFAQSVFVDGDFAYVASRDSDSLVVINVSNKSSIVQVGYLSSSSLDGAASVFVDGGYAYVASRFNDSLTVIDISKPFTQGVEVNVSSVSSSQTTAGEEWTLSCSANDGVVNSSWKNSTVVEILSSNFAPVMETSRISPIPAYDIDDLTGFCNATEGDGEGVVYYWKWYRDGVLNSSGLKQSVGNIQQVSSLSDPSSMSSAHSVFVDGDYAYVAGEGSDSLTVINISDKSNIVQVGYLSLPSMGGAMSVFVDGGFAYVASLDSDSLTVIDVSDKSSIVRRGYLIDSSLNGAVSVFVQGDFAYVASWDNDSLTVIDVSDKSSISIVDSLSNSTSMDGARSVFVDGDYAYVAGAISDSLTVIDVSNKYDIVQVDYLKDRFLMDRPFSVFVQGNYAYVASEYSDSLTVINVSYKSGLVLEDSLPSPSMEGAASVFVDGGYAYVTSAVNDSLTVINVSDKSRIVMVDSLSSPSMDSAWSVFVDGGYAYVASGDNDSLTVIDISKPFTQGVEVNVSTVSSSQTSVGENWTLSCMADDGVVNSSWKNGSVIILSAVPSNSPPSVQNIILNSTLGTNLTVENLTLHYQITDLDTDTTKPIINWYLDGSSIAVLNMPFEGSDNVLGFGDGFESGDFSAWNSANDWDINTSIVHSGSYSARANSTSTGLTTTDIDTSSADSITISFWLLDLGVPDGDNAYLRFRDPPNNWNNYMIKLTNISSSEWVKVTYTTDDPLFLFSTFRFRFAAASISSGQLFIDDVKLTLNNHTAKDYSGLGNNGTVNGVVWDASGGHDGKGAYEFDGVDDYIDVEDDPSLNIKDEITISAWVKADDSYPGGYIVAKDPPQLQNCPTANPTGPLDWSRIMGYRFSPNSNGYITHLCGMFEGGRSVKLWNIERTELTSTVVFSHNNWVCTDITDYYINSGTDYYLGACLQGAGAGGYAINGFAYPSSCCDDIYIKNGFIEYFDTNCFLDSDFKEYTSDNIYGLADIVFEAADPLQNGDSCNSDGDCSSGYCDPGTSTCAELPSQKSDVPYALSTINGGEFLIINNSQEYKAAYSGDLNDGEWHYIAATYDGSEMRLYVDGDLEDTNTDYSGPLPQVAGNVWLGRHYNPSETTGYFKGTIDDVQIYNISLSAEQIKALSDNRTDLIVSQETTSDDVWSACVTPNDGVEDGTTECSGGLIVLAEPPNNPPVMETSRISPIPAYDNDTLLGYCNATDVDGDNLTYYWRWYLNDVLDEAGYYDVNTTQGVEVNVSTIPDSYLTAEDNWTLSCKANDGEDNSSWENSTVVEILSSNNPPVMETSRISPIPAYGLDNLTGYCNATDGEGDTLTYYWQWFKDGVLNSSGLKQDIDDIHQVSSLSSSSLDAARSVFVDGDYAYVASWNNASLTVINISDKSEIVIVDSLSNSSSMDGAASVFVDGDFAYVASYYNDSLTVINISDKSSIVQVGYLSSSSMESAYSVFVDGDYAYVASYYSDSLTVINVSDKSSIVRVDYLENSTSMDAARSVFVDGDYAYVASALSDSLTVIDVSNKSDIVQVGYLSSSSLGGAWSVFVDGDFAYVASYINDSLTVIDVSNKSDIVLVDSLSSSSMNVAYSVVVDGDYAYVASGDNDSLTVIDVSNKSDIFMVDSLSSSSLDGAFSVVVDGDFAYVASRFNASLTVIDISGSFTQGGERYVSTVSSSQTSVGENWTLSCMADDGEVNSSWINSSVLILACNNDGSCDPAYGETILNCVSDCVDLDNDTHVNETFNGTGCTFCDDCDDDDNLTYFGADEICDDIDNDCDGSVDENCSCDNGAERQCGTTHIGGCSFGVQSCIGGNWSVCIGDVGPKSESCEDSIDNDCDGSIDENCTCTIGEIIPCGTDVGQCTVGIQNCTASGWGECEWVVPVEESCEDSIDNDCDGSVDENCSCDNGAERQCGSSNIGMCSYGVQVCSDDGWGECTGSIESDFEICGDSIDNDCDGSIDENCSCSPDGSTLGCGTDVGQCTVGIQNCTTGRWDICLWTDPDNEICDDIDNDCDGSVDEDCGCEDGAERQCGTTHIGGCSFGVQSCIGGNWSVCIGDVGPKSES